MGKPNLILKVFKFILEAEGVVVLHSFTVTVIVLKKLVVVKISGKL